MIGLLMRGWTPEYIHRERVCRHPFGLVWEMEESSGWKRIEGDFGKF
jgi:hypothetical protein